MKKKIAIIGAGISGLTLANLLKKSSNHDCTVYEKKTSLDLGEGYGVQLSTNSVNILNQIGFNDLKLEDKFFPQRADFYFLKTNKEICSIDIAQFNSKDINYTTIKRSLLLEFLRDKLFTNSIQFNKKVEKINFSSSKIEITFKNNNTDIFDYLVVADGVFSSTKSILFDKNIKPKYSGLLAFRTLVKSENIKFINKNNISLFLGPNMHLVTYPVSKKNDFNLIAIIRKNLDKNYLDVSNYFNNKGNIQNIIKNSPIRSNENLKNIFNIVKNIKSFPTFISDKVRKPSQNNIFFIGDAFYTSLPTLAQGASQSIESAYELFNAMSQNNFNNYFPNRLERIKMIKSRSKLNYYTFHLSNPFLVFIRNLILKAFANNKIFLNKYLGQIYNQK